MATTTVAGPHDATQWVKDLIALVDAADSDALVERIAPTGIMRFGNADPVAGRDNILAGSRGFHASLAAISHEIVHAVRLGNTILAEFVVTYTRLDGQVLSLPCANVFELDDSGLITRYQIFMDVAPVFA